MSESNAATNAGLVVSSAQDKLMTVAEVAEMLRVAPIFVYRHAAELGAFKVGSHLRFSLRRIEHWLSDQRLTPSSDPECQSPVENELVERLKARSKRRQSKWEA